MDEVVSRSGVSRTIVENLKEAAALGDLPESSQMSCFKEKNDRAFALSFFVGGILALKTARKRLRKVAG